jgi:diguanylate cyclase (GGDEF)-like protein
MTQNTLRKLEIFSSLNHEELSRVRLLMKRHEVPENWVLFREGDVGRLMYIVLSGTVAISILSSGAEELEVSRVGEGSFFGEMSILEKDVRSATCRTVEDCILLSLDSDAFSRLMDEEPAAAIKIMQRMLNTSTNRLQKTGAFLSGMVKWGENARIRAVTDDFTGLYNRRFFDEALESAVTESLRNGDSLSLVILDLDRFGALNSEYGETVADGVLKALVPAFSSAFSSADILARYGGDEFAFILPGRSGKSALECCRKAGEAIRTLDVMKGRQGSFNNITASIGISVCPEHGSSSGDLLDKADKALYAAKEAGRDRAVLYFAGDSE